MRAPALLEAAALEATEAAVVATSRATWVAEVVVVVVAIPEAVLTSSAQDSPIESSFLRRLPAVKKMEY